MKQITRSLTNPELSVLGLIVERDTHGYELESIIQERGMRNWTEIGFSSIYHILGLLEAGALIESSLEAAPGKGPARKVFRATDQGRQRYANEALGALSANRRSYPLFLQGLAALPLLEPERVADALAEYRRSLDERLEEISPKDLPGLPSHVAAMFSYSKAMIQAESEWVLDFEERIRKSLSEGGKPWA